MSNAVFLNVTTAWRETYPGAHVGILTMHDVLTQGPSLALDRRRAELEASLRSQFEGKGREAIRALPTVAAYNAYYKQFRKTYHVQLQLESVALKQRPIASALPLVGAMFVAELEHMLLTAGHDLDLVVPPITLDVAAGTETYDLINGHEQTLAQADMAISDARGVLSSIVYGPDQRTMIRPETQHVLFTVYAPAGIEAAAIEAHLAALRDCVLLVAPQSRVGTLNVVA